MCCEIIIFLSSEFHTKNERRNKTFACFQINIRVQVLAYLITISTKMYNLPQNLREKPERNQTILAKKPF